MKDNDVEEIISRQKCIFAAEMRAVREVVGLTYRGCVKSANLGRFDIANMARAPSIIG
jgi:hypothetical protein